MSLIKSLFHKIFPNRDRIPPSILGEFNIVEKSNKISGDYKDWSLSHGKFDGIKYAGNGQMVGVIDTGLDINHVEMQDRVKAYSMLPSDPITTDRVGHGTFCMGQILAGKNNMGVLGVAPMAVGIGYKVLSGNSAGNYEEFVNAFEASILRSVRDGCGVISMSLGMGADDRILNALNYAVEKGIIPVAAAGNDGVKGSLWKSYPASYENCISVSSANSKDMPAWFSSFGRGGTKKEQPEVAIASLEYYWGCVPGGYAKMVGTSMACPMVAGMALLWRQSMLEKGIMPSGSNVLEQYRQWLYRVANDTNKNGWDSELGYGVLIVDEGEL